jgi:hypothetical protein
MRQDDSTPGAAAAGLTGHELFARIEQGLGLEARRHRGVDPPSRRDVAAAGGSYRAVGASMAFAPAMGTWR